MARSIAVEQGAVERTERNPFAAVTYRWWWAMTLCMSLAVGVQIVTVPTYVLDRTDTRFLVALAVLCQTVPTAVFTLVGGAAADRFGRGRILRVTITVATLTSLLYILLSLADTAAVWPVFVIAAAVGATGAFQNPARQSLINRLAPGTRLQNGVIWGTLAFMTGQSFLGPALAGFTIAAFGLTAGFALEVLLLIGAGVCVTRLWDVDEPSGVTGSILAQIRAGLGYVRHNARIWQVLALGCVPGLCYIGVGQAVFPVFAKDTFNRGAAGIAMLNMGTGSGIIVGSILLTRWGPRQGRGRWIIRSIAAGGVGYIAAGLAPSILVAMACLFLMGLGAALFINFASTLLQTYAEPSYIGRVMSVYSLCVLGAVPLGNLHAGIGVQLSDPRIVMVYSGALSLLLGLIALTRFRAARTLD